MSIEHIILSRTDSIGDVMLTLPLAGLLKERFPTARITFIGRTYTRTILEHCAHVDHVITLEELMATDAATVLRDLRADALIHVFPNKHIARWARSAGISRRIGTTNRWWHWTTCNERVAFSRRKSDLHEAQLNVKLLAPLGISETPTLDRLAELSGFTPPTVDPEFSAWYRPDLRTVILHPGSKGSAVEWGLPNYKRLMELLREGPYLTVVTGTQAEADHYRTVLSFDHPAAIDAGGTLSLEELIGVIGGAHALVAASTGPLHIAGACGIRAIGLYASRRPIHPGRWAPIGRDAHALVFDPACVQCAAGEPCTCIHRIAPERVLQLIGA
ncbi:MAG TPA: glycosyltransferase family 9 protein [Flavobacteriales bacterium]|nr:glycosyltransferase family 9 protein [Flavobacteriales bacterium]MBK6550801.1 glycosyltransferase family 9 protein [Flavobacteriales bacterium]MBK7103373.1 glycosyltransferase family 9 protein [Flavobacteriales bacterium]MBK7113960.1 glycosyltransferase family 9 protein [Flavobacteriales bacterium]MBK7483193.1 glycosyltransferase family 9 protein [Flavobacteriales bacterium]